MDFRKRAETNELAPVCLAVPLASSGIADHGIAKDATEVASPTVELEVGRLDAEPETSFKTADIVEEVEQLLRESAPHDFDVLVIGGGSGGCAAALRASELGAHVGLINEGDLGGHALQVDHTIRALDESLQLLRKLQTIQTSGLVLQGAVRAQWSALHEVASSAVTQARTELEGRLNASGVTIISGRAQLVEEHVVEVTDKGQTQRLCAVHIIIATGSKSTRCPLADISTAPIFSSEELLDTELPPSLGILSAAPRALEIASLYSSLGVRTVVFDKESVLPRWDAGLARSCEAGLRALGVQIHTKVEVSRLEASNGAWDIYFSRSNDIPDTSTDALAVNGVDPSPEKGISAFLWTAREPSLEYVGVNNAGIQCKGAHIVVDEKCETNVPGVYAIGSCALSLFPQRARRGSRAVAEGIYVAEIIMHRSTVIEYLHLPGALRTTPPIATVGLTPAQANAVSLPVRIGTATLRSADNTSEGWVQILADEEGTLLGCQIVGQGACELIGEVALALRGGLRTDDLAAAARVAATPGEALSAAARAARAEDDGPSSRPTMMS
jgi:dihydrolipoamide dehydrogenase